ncbi:hypothetical protein HHI36_001230 [Cryptolaemus montrouzieri]|uniref:Uncharacterized protein n=1 Tax=Cryptolaemus montrouzieri TaxID=559131 RepID=A0ABD2P7S1_9CUCU
MKSLHLCDTPLATINQLLPVIREKDETLKNLANDNRNKRGLINGIGVFFEGLFGTLDADDADHYEKAINRVEKRDKHVLSLLKEPIQVVQSTIRYFNSSITGLEKNNKIFDDNFSRLHNSTLNSTANYFHLDSKQVIEERLSL